MPTRILITVPFARFAKKEKIADAVLIEAIKRVERGLVDADLGGGVLKLRIARPGKGRSGGYRTIVACVVDTRAIFLYGYPKNELENIGDNALESFRSISDDLLYRTEEEIAHLIEKGQLREVE